MLLLIHLLVLLIVHFTPSLADHDYAFHPSCARYPSIRAHAQETIRIASLVFETVQDIDNLGIDDLRIMYQMTFEPAPHDIVLVAETKHALLQMMHTIEEYTELQSGDNAFDWRSAEILIFCDDDRWVPMRDRTEFPSGINFHGHPPPGLRNSMQDPENVLWVDRVIALESLQSVHAWSRDSDHKRLFRQLFGLDRNYVEIQMIRGSLADFFWMLSTLPEAFGTRARILSMADTIIFCNDDRWQQLPDRPESPPELRNSELPVNQRMWFDTVVRMRTRGTPGCLQEGMDDVFYPSSIRCYACTQFSWCGNRWPTDSYRLISNPDNGASIRGSRIKDITGNYLSIVFLRMLIRSPRMQMVFHGADAAIRDQSSNSGPYNRKRLLMYAVGVYLNHLGYRFEWDSRGTTNYRIVGAP
ncbi:hypothetical protein EJ05DRAFT_502000 [Pseudovirgaria hyperparasitica]|uniref:Nucleotide-diphospho-sugar transferase n=1 Tax=Pseudovirgaria hyperparasitica TaxID=470096 RepID=A0A6A6W0R9_9PEZI|nr:uncharacterized protein EJ05DRAFT_502000 [Pseudovirgaria hyperparasitica]KAF2756492.1 hypothetical protein EJ05DRAFT_502000 [Pseudovirgaria hyperparasitica]